MKILFDLSATQAAGKIKNHGGGEYARAVFIKLIATCPDSVSVLLNENLSLDEELSQLLEIHSIYSIDGSDLQLICDYIENNRINLFYTALPHERYKKLVDIQSNHFKVIITIHGLRQLEYPFDNYEWVYCQTYRSRLKFLYKKLFPETYKKSVLNHFYGLLGAGKIITVSNHSREAIYRFFPDLDVNKVEVFYSPLTDYMVIDAEPDELLKKFRLTKQKYFLVLSGSIWIKNSYRAIKAFDELISQLPEYGNYKMVITGMGELVFNVKNKENFVFAEYLSRNDLEYLIKASHALVYPTLNEGFGYPPLEAMKYGVPVLVSEISAVREVCGNEASYFDPVNIEDIKQAMIRSIISEDIHSPVISSGRMARYKLIRNRQKTDLENLINLLCGHS